MPENKCTIFYNPKCSTCRNALALLEEHGVEPRLVKYLETPPTKDEICRVLSLMGASPMAIVRTKEPLWQEKYAKKTLSDEELIDILAKNPVLIERPILISEEKAEVCRPFEKVLGFVGK